MNLFTLISYTVNNKTLHDVYMTCESKIILDRLARDQRVTEVKEEYFDTIKAAWDKRDQLRGAL